MKMKKLISVVLMLALVLGAASAVAEWDAKKEIVVVSREEGSGTRGAFVELTKVEEKNDKGEKVDNTTEEALIQKGTSEVLTAVAGNEYAIGYVSLASLNETVKAVKVAGVEATAENIVKGDYTLARPFLVVVKDESNELAQDLIAFIMSKEGQEAVNANKGIAVNDKAESYQSKGLTGKLVVGGSSSVSPLMEKLIEAYKALNEGANVELQTTDSTTGVTNALSGAYDVGMASRELKDSETEKGAKGITIAMDGVAVVVNPASTVEDLTIEQIRSIFVGETTTWDGVQ